MCRNLQIGVSTRYESEGKGKRTHRSVGLRDTAAHTTEETSSRGTDTESDRGGLDFGRGEEEDGTLCRRFDPRLRRSFACQRNRRGASRE